jgi:hypothetical protein
MQNSLLALTILTAACSTTAAAKPPVSPMPDDGATVAELAQHRAQLIGWLHEYREAGVFPTDANKLPISAFKDAQGVRCPMAELLHKSGRDDLVDAVAKEANTVRLEDVHTGPLHDWMLGSGLTEEEISMVQGAMNISYEWMPAEDNHILEARAAVRAKLEIAELALRNSTGASLVAAKARLPGTATLAQLARAPVHGAVVPATAIPREVAVSVVPQRRVVMRRTYPQFQLGN